MRRFFLATFLTIFLTTQAFAEVVFYSLLPNPAGDDILGEYIELRNIGCSDIDIAGYELRDLQKGYIFPAPSLIASHSSLKLLYSASKISLNNIGLETITLKNTTGDIIDTYSYSGTQKDNVVLSILVSDADCTPIPSLSPPEETGDISSISGVSDTGSLVPLESQSTGTLISSIESSIEGVDGYSGSGIPSVENSSGSMASESGEVFMDTGIFIEVPLLSTGSYTSSGGDDISTSLAGAGEEHGSSGDLSTNGEVIIETGALIPLELYYSDADENEKIDTLEIIYPYMLTGGVSPEAILLYSNTGGLSSNQINTLTGYIFSGSLSGNTLILKIQEGDIVKTTLKITNTTTSELRLKSLSDLGFRSLGGQMPEHFLLTSSFGNYKKVYKKGVQSSIQSGGEISNISPVIISDNTGESISGILDVARFPEIIPTLQSPTNTTFSGDIFICTSSDCRINLTLEPIFSSGFAMKDYICAFGTGDMLTGDSDCNPNTFYYTTGGSLSIKLTSKKNPLDQIQKNYAVEWRTTFVSSHTSPTSTLPTEVLDIGKPIAILEIDGRWKDYYEQIDTYEMNCHTFTCSVNFTAEKSYDPEGTKVRWFWIYGPNEISDSKDPGTKKYGLGDHSIILRVIDVNGNYDEIRYQIHVLGPKPKKEKEMIKRQEKIQKKPQKVVLSTITKKKKYKKMRMLFFSEPIILLQGKSGEKSPSGEYICKYKTIPLCNINYTLSGGLRGYEYVWKVDGEEVYKGKNPLSWKLSPGIHEVKLLSYRSGESLILHENSFSIHVLAEPKKTQIRKSKRSKKTIKNVSLIKTIIPEAEAQGIMNTGKSPSENSPIGFGGILFAGGLMGAYILRRRRKI